MNKLIEMAVNWLRPVRTYRRIVDLQATVEKLNLEVESLKRELVTAKSDSVQFKRQSSSLKEWIRHVHRLDSIPVSHSIKDILQKAQV